MKARREPETRAESTPTRLRRRPSRRDEILRRAAHLFLERGFEIDLAGGRRTRLIGISKAGLYYHFNSKQELLAAIISYAQDIHEDEVRKVLTDSSADDEEELRRLIHAHALMMTHEDDAAFAILAVDEMRSLLPADRAQSRRAASAPTSTSFASGWSGWRRPAGCATSTSRPPLTPWPAWCCGCRSGTDSRAGCRPRRWRTRSPSSPCTQCCRMMGGSSSSTTTSEGRDRRWAVIAVIAAVVIASASLAFRFPARAPGRRLEGLWSPRGRPQRHPDHPRHASGSDRLSCYGSKTVETPNIDAFAAEGVRFTNAASTVPLTLPAHASIMTGLYPPGHGVRENVGYVLDERFPTLAELLGKGGWATGGFRERVRARPPVGDRPRLRPLLRRLRPQGDGDGERGEHGVGAARRRGDRRRRGALARQAARRPPVLPLAPPLRPPRAVHAEGAVQVALSGTALRRRGGLHRLARRRLPAPLSRSAASSTARWSSSPAITARGSATTARTSTASSCTTRRFTSP